MSDVNHKFSGGKQMFLKSAQSKYSFLETEKAPYYIFFDTKEIVFETDNEEEAESFVQETSNQ